MVIGSYLPLVSTANDSGLTTKVCYLQTFTLMILKECNRFNSKFTSSFVHSISYSVYSFVISAAQEKATVTTLSFHRDIKSSIVSKTHQVTIWI